MRVPSCPEPISLSSAIRVLSGNVLRLFRATTFAADEPGFARIAAISIQPSPSLYLRALTWATDFQNYPITKLPNYSISSFPLTGKNICPKFP
jgi:hypothetical protein